MFVIYVRRGVLFTSNRQQLHFESKDHPDFNRKLHEDMHEARY